jgi:hypothetical protein
LLRGILTFIFLFAAFFLKGQLYKRIEATYSIKEQLFDGSQNLQVGRVYFDAFNKQICYKISFPSKETIIVSDTIMVSINEAGIKNVVIGKGMISFSIFNLLLQGDLPYFGLQKMSFKITDIHNEDTLVVSTWESIEDTRILIDKVMLAQHNKRLFSFIGFDNNQKVVTKQFYEYYVNIDGLDIPTRVVSFFYDNDKKSIEWLNLKDIRLNNLEDNENYSFSVLDYL